MTLLVHSVIFWRRMFLRWTDASAPSSTSERIIWAERAIICCLRRDSLADSLESTAVGEGSSLGNTDGSTSGKCRARTSSPLRRFCNSLSGNLKPSRLAFLHSGTRDEDSYWSRGNLKGSPTLTSLWCLNCRGLLFVRMKSTDASFYQVHALVKVINIGISVVFEASLDKSSEDLRLQE